MQYNGWSNYPTWVTHLWLTNEPNLYEAARRVVANAKSRRDKEFNLENFVEEEVLGEHLSQAGLASDLLGWAIHIVNWRELVEALEEE